MASRHRQKVSVALECSGGNSNDVDYRVAWHLLKFLEIWRSVGNNELRSPAINIRHAVKSSRTH